MCHEVTQRTVRKFTGIDFKLAFLHVMFRNVFESFSLFSYHVLVVQTVLVKRDRCPTV